MSCQGLAPPCVWRRRREEGEGAGEGFGGRSQALWVLIGRPYPGSPAAPPPGPLLRRLKEDPGREKPLDHHHHHCPPSSSPTLTRLLLPAPPPPSPPARPPSPPTLRSPAALEPERRSSDGCGPDLATESPHFLLLHRSSPWRQYHCGAWRGSSGCAMAAGWSPPLHRGASGPAGGG